MPRSASASICRMAARLHPSGGRRSRAMREMNAGGLKVSVVNRSSVSRSATRARRCCWPHSRPDRRGLSRQSLVARTIELDYVGLPPMFGGEQSTPTARRSPSIRKILRQGALRTALRGVGRDDGRRRTACDRGLRPARQVLGPRHWQAIEQYRWCPMNFGTDWSSVIGDGAGSVSRSGMVFRDGITISSPNARSTATGMRTAIRQACESRA